MKVCLVLILIVAALQLHELNAMPHAAPQQGGGGGGPLMAIFRLLFGGSRIPPRLENRLKQIQALVNQLFPVSSATTASSTSAGGTTTAAGATTTTPAGATTTATTASTTKAANGTAANKTL